MSLFIGAAPATAKAPRTLYVALEVESDDANSGCDAPLIGTGDEGENWSDNPAAAIQAAINEAGDGDTIHICAGTWLLDQAEGDRINGDDQLSTNNAELTIEGAGANKTELISDSYGRIISSANVLGEFDVPIIIRNITLSGGYVTWNGGAVVAMGVTCEDSVIRNSQTGTWNEDTERGNGGGIYSTGPVTLDGCTVMGNTAEGSGGGVALESAALNVTNSTISNNTAVGGCCGEYGFGGGIYRASSVQELNIEGSLFVGNDSEDTGGALSARGSSDATITSTEFRGNHSDYWGGALDFNGIWTLDDLDFIENTATLGGGAIDNSGGDADVLIIENSRFVGNTSPGEGGEGGGAILNNGGNVLVSNSNFERNVIGTDSNSVGGAIYAWNIEVRDSRLSGNSAFEGGALYAVSELRSSDNVYTNNLAGESGGALYAEGELASSRDSFRGNVAKTCGAVRYNWGTISFGTFLSNIANYYGGAVCGWYAAISSSLFSGNSAQRAGAVYGATLTITGSTFEGNQATRFDGGAAILYGAVSVSRSTFNRNTAGRYGGAIAIGGYRPRADWFVSGNRFTRNSAVAAGGALDFGTCEAGSRSFGRNYLRDNRFAANRVTKSNRTPDVSVRSGAADCD